MCLADAAIQNNADLRAITPLIMKMLAAAFLSFEPMINFMKFTQPPSDALKTELSIPNFFGVLFFHLGNMMDLAFQLQNFSPAFTIPDLIRNNMSQWTLLFWTIGTSFLFATNSRFISKSETPSLKTKIYEFLGESLLVLGSSLFLFPPVNN